MSPQEQRRVALRKANDVRKRIAAFRMDTHDLGPVEGRAVLAEVLERPDLPDPPGAMRIGNFFQSARHLSAADVMRKAGVVKEAKTPLAQLSPTERAKLAKELRRREKLLAEKHAA